MPIKLIADKEEFSYTFGDATIYYRRVPGHVRANILQKNKKRGETDFMGYALDVLKYAITGWEGVEGETGPVAFKPDLVPYLPDSVRIDLTDLLDEAAPQEDRAGNSSDSSTANPSSA